MSDYVLDASAVIAYLQQEPGWPRVETLIHEHRCLLLAVNLAEVLSRLSDWNVPVHELKQHLDGLELITVPLDAELAELTADLRQSTRPLGLSLGDRACLALAKKLGAIAVTADRPWLKLDPTLGIRVECIRPNTN